MAKSIVGKSKAVPYPFTSVASRRSRTEHGGSLRSGCTCLITLQGRSTLTDSGETASDVSGEREGRSGGDQDPVNLRARFGVEHRDSDSEATGACRAGRAMAHEASRRFEEVFGELYRLAYRVSFRLLGDRCDAEDAAQEALARAHLHWARLDEHPEGWVVSVTTNISIDRLRRRRRPPTRGSEPVSLVDAYLPERLDLVRAIKRLSRRQREVVVLRYIADWPETDVADALGCSPGTVKAHASRGLATLRLYLGERDSGGDDARASG
jgi:RNA polymerase sigma factor (sigma-70 family)